MLPKTYIADYVRLQLSPEDEAEHWVTGRLRQSVGKLLTLEEMITPERAKALLRRNPSNRGVTTLKVKKIAKDISGGRWRLNGETIIVASDGHLNDGQHRLIAVVNSGIAITSNIAWGADRQSRFTVDAGSRDADDYLTMAGHFSGSLMGAAARLDLAYLSGAYWDNSVVLTATEIAGHAERIAEEISSAIKFCRRGSAKDIGTQGAIIFAFMLVRRKVGAQRAESFFDSFLDGAGPAWWVDSPAYTLRKRFLGDKSMRTRVMPCQKIELILRAWNFHVQGKRKLRSLTLQGAFPGIEG